MAALYALGILVVAAVILAALYETGKLNSVLPASMQKSGTKEGLFGVFASQPAMQHCNTWARDYGTGGYKLSYFNRCNYV